MTFQARKISEKYAPLVGIDQFGEAAATDELQFWNYGYWLPETKDPKQASSQLLDKLIGELPQAPASILDVAFGQGQSTRQLCAIYGAENVTGINIAADQIAHARRSGVRCPLLLMDAGNLSVPERSFDGILCMEAAFHFNSRRSFLEGAYRALRPGGRLVMSDLLFRSNYGLDADVFPPVNQVADLAEYRSVLAAAGFSPDLTRIEVTTSRQLQPYLWTLSVYAGLLPYPDPERIDIEAAHSRDAILFILTRLLNISDCVMVVATKG